MTAQRDFAAEPSSAGDVRRFIKGELSAVSIADDVVLAASELAANVIRHARTDFTVRLVTDHVIRLEVSDGSSIIPAVEDLAESSRGLRMIEAMSQSWGVESHDGGKVVWAEFALGDSD